MRSLTTTLLLAAALSALLLTWAPAAEAKRVRGIDVSRFQGKINWSKVGETKLQFAFVQASRGSGSDCAVVPERCGGDELYERNYRRARANGLPVGAYHRAFTGGGNRRELKLDARAEARLFVRKVGELRGGDLLPALDVETPFGGLGQRALRQWIRIWLNKVENELGAKPIIYTNRSSWQATGNTTAFARAGHQLWVANFDVKRPAVPAGNWDGSGWSIWQYTSTGRVNGIKGNVDKNRLRRPLAAITAR